MPGLEIDTQKNKEIFDSSPKSKEIIDTFDHTLYTGADAESFGGGGCNFELG